VAILKAGRREPATGHVVGAAKHVVGDALDCLIVQVGLSRRDLHASGLC
jgi:hypothetical protein